MSFPKPLVLNSLIDHYINRRQGDWNSVRESAAWFFTKVTFGTYEGKDVKEKICNELKASFLAPVASDSSEIIKWTNLCILLGNIATTLKNNNTSMLAKYLHAIRSYILSQLTLDDTKKELDACIANLKNSLTQSITNEFKNDEKAAQYKKECEDTLFKLVYLGDLESLTAARQRTLIDNSSTYYEKNYHSTKFFTDEIKSNSIFTNFDTFEATALTPAVERKTEDAATSKPLEEKKNVSAASTTSSAKAIKLLADLTSTSDNNVSIFEAKADAAAVVPDSAPVVSIAKPKKTVRIVEEQNKTTSIPAEPESVLRLRTAKNKKAEEPVDSKEEKAEQEVYAPAFPRRILKIPKLEAIKETNVEFLNKLGAATEESKRKPEKEEHKKSTKSKSSSKKWHEEDNDNDSDYQPSSRSRSGKR